MAGLFSRFLSLFGSDDDNDDEYVAEVDASADGPAEGSNDRDSELNGLEVGMGVEIVHAGGMPLAGVIQEKNAGSITLVSNPGGIRFVLSSADIVSWTENASYSIRNNKSKKSKELSAEDRGNSLADLQGKITHYGDNHLGWIIGEDGLSYGFNLRDTSEDLSDYLLLSFDKSNPVTVAFTPKTFMYNKGLKKTIATNIHLIDQPATQADMGSALSGSGELEGVILFLKKSSHAGQIKGGDGHLYRYSRISLDEPLLVYLSSADAKNISGFPIVFRVTNASRSSGGDIEAGSMRSLRPLENDPTSSAGKAAKELREGNFSCASVLFRYAIDNGYKSDAESAIADYVLECKSNPPVQKAMTFFNNNLEIIPESIFEDLLDVYKLYLSNSSSSTKYPAALIHTIDVCMHYRRYEFAQWYCLEWKNYYDKSHPAVRRRLAGKVGDVESKMAICLYRLDQKEEADAIAFRYRLSNPSDVLANSIINRTLDEQGVTSDAPLRFVASSTEKEEVVAESSVPTNVLDAPESADIAKPVNQTNEQGYEIPDADKKLIHDLLTSAFGYKKESTSLSEAVSYLRIRGVDPRQYGYAKAKPFFEALPYVEVVDKSNSNLPPNITLKHDRRYEVDCSKEAAKARKARIEGDFTVAEEGFRYVLEHGSGKDIESALGDCVSLFLQMPNRENDAVLTVEKYGMFVSSDKKRNLEISIYQKTKDYERLIPLYDGAFKRGKSAIQKSHFLGLLISSCIQVERYEEGYEACKKWHALHSQNKYSADAGKLGKYEPTVRRNEAICLFHMSRVEEAERIAQGLILTNPGDAVANSILNGTYASDSVEISTATSMADDLTFDEDALDEQEYGRITQGSYIFSLISSADISQYQKQHLSDGRYTGTPQDAVEDMQRLLQSRTGLTPRMRAERRFVACAIIQQLESSADYNKEDLPWYTSYYVKTAARGMASWGNLKISIGQLDTSRMAYLFAIANLRERRVKRKKDEDWHNSLDFYLNSFYLGADLSSYVESREKIKAIDEITDVFSTRNLPNAIVPAFLVGIFELLEALEEQNKARKLIESSLYEKSVELRKSIVGQLSVVLEENLSETIGREPFISALERACSERRQMVVRTAKDISDFFDIMFEDPMPEAVLDETRQREWRTFFSETDSRRIASVIDILSRSQDYYSDADFDSRSECLRSIMLEIRDLQEEISNGPTEFSYEVILPELVRASSTAGDMQGMLYAEFPPRLSWQESLPPYKTKSGYARVHLSISNDKGCQSADSIKISLDNSSATNEVLAVESVRLTPSVRNFSDVEVMLDAQISSSAEKAGSFTLPLLCEYSYKEMPSQPLTNHTLTWEIPLVIHDEDFTPYTNPYSTYVGGNPITDENDSMFYGREQEKQKLVGMVQTNGKMNYGCGVAMYGQTRTGKSSLLGQVKNAIMRQYGDGILLCDMGNIGGIQSDVENKDRYLAEFLYHMLGECCDSIAENARLAEIVDSSDYEPPFEMLDNPAHASPLFHRYMKKLDKVLREEGMIILLIIDEFTYLHSLIKSGAVTESFMRMWKAILQDYCVFTIVVGQDDMPEFMHEYPNEFACMETIKLTYLDEASARALIHEPLEIENGRDEIYRKDAIDTIYSLTAGSAFLTMKICAKLVDYLNEVSAKTVTASIVSAFLEHKAFGSRGFLEEKDFEPQLIERGHPEYNGPTKKILHSIAVGESETILVPRSRISCDGLTEEEVSELLGRLVDRNVLAVVDGKYGIGVGLLMLWLIKTMGRNDNE